MKPPTPFVDADWLVRHARQVVIADVRWYLDDRSGRDAHASGHLPGAVFVDVDTDLSGPPGPATGRHPLPEPASLARALSRLGIGDGDTVIAYDDTGGSTAARLVWMLRAAGEHAAVLDGGMQAWPGPLSTAAVRRAPARFTPRPWPADLIADAGAVDRLRTDPDAVVLDARSPARYRGDVEPVDARAGHIPGARNAPWTANLDPRTGRLAAPAALRARYEALGVSAGTQVVASCGSGVTACLAALAVEAAGLGRPRLYPGSWSQWSADAKRPAAVGDEP